MTAVIDAFRDHWRLSTVLPITVWVAMPFTLGALIGDALGTTADPFRTVASVGAWVWWFTTLTALLVARPVTLTLTRLAIPAGLVAALWATVESDDTTLAIVGVVAAGVAALVIFLPGVGDRFVDGVSYGDERRFLLRPPGPVLLVAGPVAGVVTIAGATIGPLLLADQRWILGSIITLAGFLAAFVGFRTLNQLTRRFIVFVPNGVVIHDTTVMPEPVLFTTREVAGLGPAIAETSALDLTSQALGLALELKLVDATELTVVTGRTESEDQRVRSLLVSPTRPAAVMAVALERGLPIG